MAIKYSGDGDGGKITQSHKLSASMVEQSSIYIYRYETTITANDFPYSIITKSRKNIEMATMANGSVPFHYLLLPLLIPRCQHFNAHFFTLPIPNLTTIFSTNWRQKKKYWKWISCHWQMWHKIVYRTSFFSCYGRCASQTTTATAAAAKNTHITYVSTTVLPVFIF